MLLSLFNSCEDFELMGDPVKDLDEKGCFNLYVMKDESTGGLQDYIVLKVPVGDKFNTGTLTRNYSSPAHDLEPGYRPAGWKISSLNPTHDIKNCYQTTEGYITSFDMPSGDVILYGESWTARDDVPVRIAIKTQETADSAWNNYPGSYTEYIVTGTADQEFIPLKAIRRFSDLKNYEVEGLYWGNGNQEYYPASDVKVYPYGNTFFFIFVKRKTVKVTIAGGSYGKIISGPGYTVNADGTVTLEADGGYNAGKPLSWPTLNINVTNPEIAVDSGNWNYSYTDEEGNVVTGICYKTPSVYPEYDTTYTPYYKKAEGSSFTISYKLVGKDGAVKDIDTSKTPYASLLTSGRASQDNVVSTIDTGAVSGIFYDENCTESLKENGDIFTIPADKDIGGDIVLYVKAEKASLYIDIENGDDSNCGFNSGSAVNTVSEAKKYYYDDSSKQSFLIRGCVPYTDLENKLLNGLDVVRYEHDSSYSPLIEIPSGGNVTLKETVIRGLNQDSYNSAVAKINGTVNFTNLTFSGFTCEKGTAEVNGAAIEVNEGGFAVINNTTFEKIKTQFPMIYGKNGSIITISNSTFSGNTLLGTSSYSELPDIYSDGEVQLVNGNTFQGVILLGDNGTISLSSGYSGTVTVDLNTYKTGKTIVNECTEELAAKITLVNESFKISSDGSLVLNSTSFADETQNGTKLPESTTVSLSTPQDICALSKISQLEGFNSGDGYTFELQNSIDMSSVTDFTPINSYKGTFNGNGYEIQNLTINTNSDGQAGFFEKMVLTKDSELTVKFVNCKISNATGMAGILTASIVPADGKTIYELSGVTVSNCEVTTTGNSCGGIAGNVTSSLSDCTVTNTKVQGKMYVGGVSGMSLDSINNCSVDSASSVTATASHAGGITGYIIGDIIQCNNNGTVSAVSEKAGGIAGFIGVAGKTYSIDKCSNTGSVTVSGESTESLAGGIAGTVGAGTVTIKNSYNTGTVSGTGFSCGGIAGSLSNSSSIINCYNQGEVHGASTGSSSNYGTGGLCGTFIGNLYYSYTSGKVTGISDNTSAFGMASGSGSVYNCFAYQNSSTDLYKALSERQTVVVYGSCWFSSSSYELDSTIYKYGTDNKISDVTINAGHSLVDTLNELIGTLGTGYNTWSDDSSGLPVFDN